MTILDFAHFLPLPLPRLVLFTWSLRKSQEYLSEFSSGFTYASFACLDDLTKREELQKETLI
jgi:hypothetical protein